MQRGLQWLPPPVVSRYRPEWGWLVLYLTWCLLISTLLRRWGAWPVQQPLWVLGAFAAAWGVMWGQQAWQRYHWQHLTRPLQQRKAAALASLQRLSRTHGAPIPVWQDRLPPEGQMDQMAASLAQHPFPDWAHAHALTLVHELTDVHLQLNALPPPVPSPWIPNLAFATGMLLPLVLLPLWGWMALPVALVIAVALRGVSRQVR